MRHRSGSFLLGVALTAIGFAATGCHTSPNGGTRGYGSAPAPQARAAYVAPVAKPAYVAPTPAYAAPAPAYAAPAPTPVAYAAPSRSGSTAYVFLASWCGYCKRLEANTLPNAQVQSELASLNWKRVNPDSADGKQMAARYGIGGYPTTLVLDGSGNVVTKIVGFQEPAAYASALRAAHR